MPNFIEYTDFKKRIAIALNSIDKTDQALGQIFGVSKNTIAAYKKEKGDLKGNVLFGLVRVFSFNPLWLLTGQGEMYPDGSVISEKPDIKNDLHLTQILKGVDAFIDASGLILTHDQKAHIISYLQSID
jgi:hypothetical protein